MTRKTTMPKFLRHRTLVATEVLLLISLAKDLFGAQVRDAGVANAWKVLLVMAITLGVLGVLFLLLERLTTRGVAKTHEVVKALPVPLPMLVIHALTMGGLFYLYAWYLDLPVWPMVGAH